MGKPLVEGTIEDDSSIVATESSIIAGYSGDDNLIGSAFSDELYGGLTEWHDGPLLPGYVGAALIKVGDNDSIFGGAGDDFIMVGLGTDTIDGGDNYDQINFQFTNKVSFVKLETIQVAGQTKQHFKEFEAVLANVSVDLQAGTYNGRYWSGNVGVGTALGYVKNVESVIGSIGDDTINGDGNDNAFKPIGGDDIINGRGGFDILSYNDLAQLGILLDYEKQTVLDGFGGKDRFANIEIVIGGKFNDTMRGSTAADRFTGNAGHDEIDGAGGRDTVDYSWELGTNGIIIDLNAAGTSWDSFGTRDSLKNVENIIGTSRGDFIEGRAYVAETFWGRDGNDTLSGYGAEDTLFGGNGNDKLDGGGGLDTLMGESGNDTLLGGDGDDRLEGGDDNDKLDGQKGLNTLLGGTGNDTLKGGDDADKLDGGEGADQLTDNTIVDAEALTSRSSNNNTLLGGAGNDTIKGVGKLSGGDDNDMLVGMGKLSGDGGNDTLTAKLADGAMQGQYAVTLVGGEGNDTLIDGVVRVHTAVYAVADYEYASHGIDASLLSNQVTVGAGDVDTLVGIFGLRGSEFGDLIWGSDEDYSFLLGGGGDDTMVGGKAGAVIEGGKGNDSVTAGGEVYGGDGNDTLDGGLFAEVLNGGDGDDVISFAHRGKEYDVPRDEVRGGADDDTIHIGALAFVNVWGNSGRDVVVLDSQINQVNIMDFKPGTDKIDLRGTHFTTWKQVKAGLHPFDTDEDAYLKFDGNTVVNLWGARVSEFDKGDFIL